MNSQIREGVSGDAGSESIREEVGVVADDVLTVVALIGYKDVSTLKLQVPVSDDAASV